MNKKTFVAALFIAAMILSLTAGVRIEVAKAQAPKTIVVPDDYSSIQDAIDAANPGDTVYVKDGTYYPVGIDKPLTLIGEDRQKTIISYPNYPINSDYPDIYVEASNVTISNFTITGPGADAIDLSYAYPYPSNISLIGNTINDVLYGIETGGGENYFISDNNITGNTVGISFASSNSTISGNNVDANSPIGIAMGNCQNVTVKDNGIYGSVNNPNFESGGGIALEDGGPFYVYGNSIVYNEGFGLEFYGCNNSTVYNNDILSNNIGIGLENYTGTESWSNVGSGNEVYNNNLIGNAQDVAVGQRSDLVSWDNGYVGNYWSDYQTNYPNASEIGNSGIWNTPYVIDANNTDHYPLMNQIDIDNPAPNPLNISIVSPMNGTTFTVSFGQYPRFSIPLIYTTNTALSWVGYSLNGESNVTVTGNGTLINDPSISDNQFTLTLYANDTSGNWATPQTVTCFVYVPADVSTSPRNTGPALTLTILIIFLIILFSVFLVIVLPLRKAKNRTHLSGLNQVSWVNKISAMS